MWFLLICALAHTLPAPVLNELGHISDLVSDMSPEFLRGVEHVVFSMMLN